MRKNKKLIATLAVFALMLVASIFCTRVFASADEDDLSDFSTLMSADTVVVSGCDLKKDNLEMVSVDRYGFSMMVPKGGMTLTLDTEKEVFDKYGISKSALTNQGLFMASEYGEANKVQIYAVVTDLSSINNTYGSYSGLSQKQKDELIAEYTSMAGSDATVKFVNVNGVSFLSVSGIQADYTGSSMNYYRLVTVIGDQEYDIELYAENPVDSDLEVINYMLNSVRVKGISQPMSAVEITLIVVTLLLVIAVGFILFLLYRMNKYLTSGMALKSVIALDLPETAVNDDDEEIDDEDAIDDLFDDDEVVEDEVKTVDDTDEVSASDDDERIISD